MRLRVLAVCAGNICRSPAAVAAIDQAARSRGLELDLDSAGTGSWNLGQPPTPQIVAAGKRVGLEIRGRARKVNSTDFDRFDVILAMDHANLRDLTNQAPSLEARAKIRLFRTYDLGSDEDEIPDPYGGPVSGYERTLDLILASAAGFIDSLVSAGVEDSVTLE